MFSKLKQVALERGKTFSPAVIISDFESGILPVLKTEVSIFCVHSQKSFFIGLLLVSNFKAYGMLFSLLPSYISRNTTARNATAVYDG